jgi:hypothetical protein
MAAAARPGAEGLVAVLPSVVDVVPTRDVYGAHGFAPLNQMHTRLATRVFTLLIADYLTRPDAYLADPPAPSDGPFASRRQEAGCATPGV